METNHYIVNTDGENLENLPKRQVDSIVKETFRHVLSDVKNGISEGMAYNVSDEVKFIDECMKKKFEKHWPMKVLSKGIKTKTNGSVKVSTKLSNSKTMPFRYQNKKLKKLFSWQLKKSFINDFVTNVFFNTVHEAQVEEFIIMKVLDKVNSIVSTTINVLETKLNETLVFIEIMLKNSMKISNPSKFSIQKIRWSKTDFFIL